MRWLELADLDQQWTVEEQAAGEEKVWSCSTWRGTPGVEFPGIPPTDKEAAFSSMEFNRVVDGKVEEHWVELDLFGLMQQLGAIPEPGHSEEASPT